MKFELLCSCFFFFLFFVFLICVNLSVCFPHLLASKEHLLRLLSLHMVCNTSFFGEMCLYDFSKPILILCFPNNMSICPSVVYFFSRWSRTLNALDEVILKSCNLLIWYPSSCCDYGILESMMVKKWTTCKFFLVCLCSWTAYRRSSKNETMTLRTWNWNSRICKV